uniref:RING-type E3 ubiquitin transferase n=1 Tax=Brassica campestris TaxID=3711 RepID=M4ERK5_BRACM
MGKRADEATVKYAHSLRDELRKVSTVILDEKNHGRAVEIEAIEEAIRILNCLEKIRSSLCSSAPEEFLCPLSKEIMRDPVVLTCGQSYERYYIDRWLREVNHSVCPKPLSHTKLIPNKALSSHIRQWCKENLVDLPETVAACSDMSIVKTLIDKISSSSVSSQRPTAMLGYIQHFPSSTLTKLLDPLLKPDVDIDPELQSDLVKTVFYLSSHEENKTFIGQNPSIINTLMSCLKQGSKETRRDAAATFALLSSTGSSLRVLALLVDLLAQGDDSAFDAVSSLCVLEENRDRAVLAGAVRVLTKKLQADAMVDHSLSLLALLSTSQNAVEQMTELALVFTLLKFLRRSTYQPNVENALVTIFNVSERDGSGLEFVSKEEKQKRTLTSVVVNGSEHAQTMALRILQVAAGSRR